MKLEVLADAHSVARRAAAVIAAEARLAVAARGRFLLAVSGGRTPWAMLRALAHEDVPWPSVHVFQVDERVAPAGHPERNLTHLAASLLAHAPLPLAQLHAMPVESTALEEAGARYARTLEEHAGRPVVLDVVHLGLGPDGHTASLVPGDAVLDVSDADVSVTGGYCLDCSRPTRRFPPGASTRAERWCWLTERRRLSLRETRRALASPENAAERVYVGTHTSYATSGAGREFTGEKSRVAQRAIGGLVRWRRGPSEGLRSGTAGHAARRRARSGRRHRGSRAR